MGLTDFRPFFKVTVDNADITGILAPRLKRLLIADAAGVESDRVTITLTDAGIFKRLDEPRQGAEIKVWLGYAFNLRFMGTFVADTVRISGPPDELEITAMASPHGQTDSGKSALTEQKMRSWASGTTIGDLVKKVASEHGMVSAVSDALASIELPHIDQLEESDINLLSRVVREYDGIAKPGDGRIVIAKRGESRTASGRPMPRVVLTPRDVTRWAYDNSLREKVGKVVASYQDRAAAETKEEAAEKGDGPVQRLRQRYATKAAARAAAQAEIARQRRAGRRLNLFMPGNSDLVAEAQIEVSGFRDYVDGAWLIITANHSLDSQGYRTTIRCEPPE